MNPYVMVQYNKVGERGTDRGTVGIDFVYNRFCSTQLPRLAEAHVMFIETSCTITICSVTFSTHRKFPINQ